MDEAKYLCRKCLPLMIQYLRRRLGLSWRGWKCQDQPSRSPKRWTAPFNHGHGRLKQDDIHASELPPLASKVITILTMAAISLGKLVDEPYKANSDFGIQYPDYQMLRNSNRGTLIYDADPSAAASPPAVRPCKLRLSTGLVSLASCSERSP